VRSVSSVTLHLLRMLEEMLLKGATHDLVVRTRSEVALYALNHKRAHLRELESRFQITITVNADATIGAAQPFLIEKGELVHSVEAAKAIAAQHPAPTAAVEEDDADVVDDFAEEEIEDTETASEGEQAETEEQSAEGQPRENGDGQRRGRRRRRGRGGREDREPREGGFTPEHAAVPQGDDEGESAEAVAGGEDHGEHRPAGAPGTNGDGEHRRRRRGRRGGRRNRRGREGEPGFAGANGGSEEHQPHSQGFEPEVADAAADLGGPGHAEAPPAPQPQTPEPFEPVARDAPRAVSLEPAPSPEPPRRRSTIREPAPMFSSGAMSDVQPSPAPEPAPPASEPVSMPEPAAAAATQAEPKPRRFGWWNRRG
jgi:ribonuclease E